MLIWLTICHLWRQSCADYYFYFFLLFSIVPYFRLFADLIKNHCHNTILLQRKDFRFCFHFVVTQNSIIFCVKYLIITSFFSRVTLLKAIPGNFFFISLLLILLKLILLGENDFDYFQGESSPIFSLKNINEIHVFVRFGLCNMWKMFMNFKFIGKNESYSDRHAL